MTKRILIFWALVVMAFSLRSQGNKISITCTQPASLTVCGSADTFSINLLNITAGSISGITFTAQLPGGILYVSGSVSGSGITESNISNLNAPVFAVPNMGIGSSYAFKIRASAACGVITYLNGGGAITNTYTVNYTGNFDRLVSNPYTIKIPNLVITSISNQTYAGNLNSTFVRNFTITNTGQGSVAGFTFRQINKNGTQVIYFNGGSTAQNGDTITHTYSSANFTGIGNNNGTFDYQESIIIRDTIKITACTNLTSTFSVWWGCNNSICQQNTSAGNVVLNQQLPNVVISAQPSLNTCYGGNNVSVQQLTMINNGSGLAKSLQLNIYHPASYYSRFDTASIMIKSGLSGSFVRFYPSSVTNANTSGTLSCLGTNPIGGFVLTFANINAADTIYIKWNAYTCCPQACNGYPATMGWQYNGTYKDQCLVNTYSIVNTWGRVYDQAGLSVLPSTPSDINTGQSKTFRYLITNYALFSMNNSNTDFELNVTLPAGLKWVSGNISNANGTAFWNASSSSIVGNNYRGYFTGPPPFNLLQAEFLLNIAGDCSMSGASTGNKTISISFKHRPNRSCSDSCSIPLLCFSTNVYLHCGSSCPTGGMIFKDYTILRTSYGKPDNNNDGLPDTGSVNLTKIRDERAMVGDTITAVFKGLVKTGGPNSNFQYGYAHSTIVYGSYLTEIAAKVVVQRASNGVTYTCNNVGISSSTAGTTRTFAYDFSIPTIGSLGGCVSPAFRYNNNDTVILTVKYKVGNLPAGAVLNGTVTNDYYLSNVANPTLAGNIFECDTFSGNFALIGYYFTNYGKNVFTHNSCSNITVSQNYYLSIGNCCSNYSGGNLFPFEYRSWAHLKSAKFIKPKGYSFVSASFNQVRTAGTLNTSTQSIASIVPVSTATDTLLFDIESKYKGYGGTIDSSDDGFLGTLNVTLSPTCNVVQNTVQQFPTYFVFKEHAVLSNNDINFPPGVETDEGTYIGPNITVLAALDTVKGLSDTAYWDITVFNSSGASSANNVWIAFQTTPTISIASVTTLAGTPVSSVNGIYQLGNMAASTQKTYRIKANYRSCSKDSIQVFTGANCPAYPTSLASFNCNTASRVLYVMPQIPGFQASITDSVATLNLCTQSPYTLVINNIQEANAYNVRVQVTLPIGLTLVPGSTRLNYPFSSTPKQIANPVLISGTTYEWNLNLLDTTIGKYGITGVTDTSRSSLKIRFYVKTDCNYSSGGIIRIKVLGTSACGANAPQLQAVSNPLKITGVTTPYFALVQMSSDTINPCAVNSTSLKVHIFNIGIDSTRNADYYQVILPAGMNYISGSFNAVHNAPINGIPTISNINGQQFLEWQIPPLIPRLDSVDFSFNVTVADYKQMLCGRNDIYSQAVVKQSVLCVASNTNCLINSITGYNLNPLMIQKGVLSFTSFTGSALALPPASELISISYSLQNSGSRIDSNNTIFVKFYFDADSNGVFSTSDLLLQADTLNNNIAKNATINRSKSFVVPTRKTCTIIAVVDTGSCICATSQRLLLNPPLPFAGSDKLLCSNFTDTIGIDSLSGYNYSWQPVTGLSNPNKSKTLVTIINPSAIIQTYQYFVTVKRGSCSYTDTVNIQVFPKIYARAGNDQFICPGDSLQIGLNAFGGTPPYKYKWLVNTNMRNDTIATTWVRPLNSTTYIVKVTDALNCINYDTVTISISPWPTAKFKFNDACIYDSISFIDSSVVTAGVVSNWYWNFGDGNTSNLQHPKHKYAAAGNYVVKLKIQSNIGCKDSTTSLVKVFPKPVAGYAYTLNCYGDTTLFVDTSKVTSGNIASWLWDFGDGDTSHLQNPKHLFDTIGQFQVLLTIYSDDGCMDTISKMISISPKPKAGFFNNIQCRYDSVTFTDTSSIITGNIIQWLWDFGDSITSTLQYPKHLYQSAGTKTVSLKVTAFTGCTDSLSKTIQVNPVPVTNFSYSNICFKDSAHFINLSAGATTFKWFFGDGQTSTLIGPTHYYTSPGVYQVKLITSNSFGCNDSISKSITVYPKPNAAFFASSVCEYDSVVFNNVSSVNGGNIVGYSWDFGDGQTTTIKNPKHRYATGGNYNVTLKAITDFGCIDSITSSIIVYAKPTSKIGVTLACKGDTTFFTDNSVANNGSIIQRLWNFGDGGTSNTINPIHKYADTGYYHVKLRVMNTNNCIDSSQLMLYVNAKPVSNFNVTSTCEDDSFYFVNNSTITNGGIVRYDWDFGDGYTSNQINPSHIYSNPGTYTVRLSVQSDSACNTKTQKTVTVFPKPKADFYVLSTCFKDSVSFIDTSSSIAKPYTIVSYFYRFGDGGTSTQISPKHKYAAPGNYIVTLICISDKGCVDSITKTISIASVPQTGFYYLKPCFQDTVQFIDTTMSTSPITYRKWYFGDGFTSTLQNPSHLYLTSGTYKVSLVCKNGNSCGDSITIPVIIYPKPRANFLTSNTCPGSIIPVFDMSNGNGSAIVKYLWTFSDGYSDTSKTPQHFCTNCAGNSIKISLRIETIDGCTDTISKMIKILTPPKAAFSFDTVCVGNASHFYDRSVANATSMKSWTYYFDDTTLSTNRNATHIFKTSGIHQVLLVVVNGDGCIDSISQMVLVTDLPEVRFGANITDGCIPLLVQFIDSTIINFGVVKSWLWEFGDKTTSDLANPIHLYSLPGKYAVKLTVTSGYNCKSQTTAIDYITVNALPKADFDALPDSTTELNSEIHFLNRSTGATQWYWDFGNATSATDENPQVIYGDTGKYKVRLVVESPDGCRDTIYRKVVITPAFSFYIPNAFSPNQDFNSLNEKWGPKGMFKGYQEYRLTIYDRWGMKLFYTNDIHETWDGLMPDKKTPAPEDVYIYSILVIDFYKRDHYYKGELHLIR